MYYFKEEKVEMKWNQGAVKTNTPKVKLLIEEEMQSYPNGATIQIQD